MSETENNSLRIKFKDGKSYRTVYVSAAWFSRDVKPNVRMAFYNEHISLPQEITLLIDRDKPSERSVEDFAARVEENTLVREFEIEVVMSVEDAEQFHETLGKNIEMIKRKSDEQD